MGILSLVVSDSMSKNRLSIQEAMLWFTHGLAVATIYENHFLPPRKRQVEGEGSEGEKELSALGPMLHESKFFFVGRNALHFLSRVMFWDSSCLPEITCIQIFASGGSLKFLD